MDTHIATGAPAIRTRRRAARAAAVLALAPLTAAGGVVWALVQPWRLTLLAPAGRGFWELAVEPPLLVVVAALAFHLLVARGLAADLERGSA